ncbi:MAG: hypothetical protein WC498_02080 [Candidatus Saccharimonadales bacterium]
MASNTENPRKRGIDYSKPNGDLTYIAPSDLIDAHKQGFREGVEIANLTIAGLSAQVELLKDELAAARQAAITQGLAEIAGGAEVLNG